ncbi:MAG: hypothetical protein ACLQVJ_03310 [Syntrophobacteraceae bacterium]
MKKQLMGNFGDFYVGRHLEQIWWCPGGVIFDFEDDVHLEIAGGFINFMIADGGWRIQLPDARKE